MSAPVPSRPLPDGFAELEALSPDLSLQALSETVP